MYRALYRKWRPATFEDVVGQAGITTALKNQILHDKVGHAYIFTGTRGTGKTTCAKIFAKAVNCQSRNGADPCGQCPVCTGIDDGSVMWKSTPHPTMAWTISGICGMKRLTRPVSAHTKYILSTRCTCSPQRRSMRCSK